MCLLREVRRRDHPNGHTVTEVCKIFGISRQGYYQYEARAKERQKQEDQLIERVKTIRAVMPMIGGKKIYFMIKGSDTEGQFRGIGRDKFFRILKERKMLVKRRARTEAPGTDSRNTATVYPNLKKDRVINHVNEVIESDMTAIRIKDGYKPLSICIDVYSRKIIGYKFNHNWSASETVGALRAAYEESGQNLSGGIHHSDQGKQYGSDVYAEVRQSFGLVGSMSRKATPTDAAHVERVNRTLKREFNLRRQFSTFEEAERAIYQTVLIYNELRPHWSLRLKTPSQVYAEGRL